MMAMKSTAVTALFLAVLLSPEAFGQANPLIGSWRSSGQTGSNGYTITYTYLVSFSPNGMYENRMDVAGARGGAGAGGTHFPAGYRVLACHTEVFCLTRGGLCPPPVRWQPVPRPPPHFL